MPQCTVLENVLLPTLVPGNKQDQDTVQKRAKSLLEKVGLSERLSHRPSQLSGGERQRVAVVRALINSPELILADEATGSLDQANAHELVNLLNQLQKSEAISMIMVTHDAAIAQKMNRCLRLENGSLKAVD